MTLKDMIYYYGLAACVFGAASAGFLAWNRPPARIFMGDVGSGYLGYSIALFALASARSNSVALLVWLILTGVFFVDATVTLLRRLLRRDPVYVAHRSHAYQWLARRWRSHAKTTVVLMSINIAWLFPCAWIAASQAKYAGWIVILALAPLVLLALASGAGRAEL